MAYSALASSPGDLVAAAINALSPSAGASALSRGKANLLGELYKAFTRTSGSPHLTMSPGAMLAGIRNAVVDGADVTHFAVGEGQLLSQIVNALSDGADVSHLRTSRNGLFAALCEAAQNYYGYADDTLNLLAFETSGFSVDGLSGQTLVRWPASPSNQFSGDWNTKMQYTSPPTKRIVDSTLAYVAGTTMRTAYLLAGTALGLTIERQRTQEIRNNSMQGVSAGSPGTLPTNWSVINGTGLTRTIVGSGTVNGIDYIDIRFAGTTGDTAGTQICAESATQIVAASGDVWTHAAFVALVGGSLTNVSTVTLRAIERTAAGGFVKNQGATDIKGSLTSTLQRFAAALTLDGGGTVARLQPALSIGTANGVAVDFTLRYGWPTMVKMPYVLTPIRTTTIALTPASDDITQALSGISFSATNNIVVIEGRTAAGAGTQPLLQLDDGTANERIRILRDSSNNLRCIVTDGGVEQCNLDLGTVAANTDFKLAFAWAANDFAASLNGGTIVTDTGGTLPTVTTMRLGADTGTDRWDSTIEIVKLLPRAKVNNAEIVAMAA